METLGSFDNRGCFRGLGFAKAILIFFGVMMVAMNAQVAHSDQQGASGATLSEMVPGSRERETAAKEQATDRQNDDRLPPVLPGEEVITETGQHMRVWSSAGPVPINRQPTPTTFNGGYGGPSVIVDGRNQNGIGPVVDRNTVGDRNR